MTDCDTALREVAALVSAALRNGAPALEAELYPVAFLLGDAALARPEATAAELRKALGIPGPRSVTYDMADRETFAVLTAALEAFGAEQRDRAKAEGGNQQRTRWAAKAAQMLHDADTARNTGDGDGA